jgi:lycopene beta-cyclase
MAHQVHIVGAGLAGTCLALSLLEAKFDGEITLYDSATRFDRERHWCAWGPLPRYLRPYISHSWREVEIVTPEESVRRRTTGTPYVHIEGRPFLAEAHRRIRRANNVCVRLGENIEPEDLTHGYVFDATSRPCGEPALIQSAVSRVLRFDRPVAGRAARLMDFRRSGERDIRFMTVLPFGPREALVRTTRVDDRGSATEEDLNVLDAYVASEFDARARVLSTTERSIPILFEDPSCVEEPMRARLGVCGCAVPGTARYGLARVVAQVAAMTPAVVRGERLPALRPHAAVRWVESQLLDRIVAGPSPAMQAFASMFRAPTEAATRFLSGRPTWSDLTTVLLSLPRRPLTSPAHGLSLATDRMAA